MPFAARILAACALACAILAAPSSSAAKDGEAGLKILTAQWGFDGKASPDAFNQLAVLLSNDSRNPFNGVVELSQSLLLDAGAETQLQEAYLSPGSKKWLFFSPFLAGKSSVPWRLKWGKGKNEEGSVPAPGETKGSTVFLSSQDSLPSRSGLRVFPDALFPSAMATTVSLRAVALCEEPKLSKSQAETFMAWLKAGGELFVGLDAKGELPLLSGDLAELNASRGQAKAALGRGSVHWLRLRPQDFNERALAENGGESSLEGESDAMQTIRYGAFSYLKSLVKVERPWTAIYIAAVFFIGLASLGNYLAGRLAKGWLSPLAFGLGAAALFTIVFAVIGARGAWEKSSVNDVTLARSLGGASFECFQFLNVFATSGGERKIAFKEQAGFLSGGGGAESSRDRVVNGQGAFFLASMPRYSSVSLTHTTKTELQGFSPQLSSSKIERGKLKSLKIDFGKGKMPLAAWAVFNGEVYELNALDGKESLVQGAVKPLSKLEEQWRSDFNLLGFSTPLSPSRDFETLKDRLAPGLICAALAGRNAFSWRPGKSFPTTAERIELFALYETPPELQAEGSEFSKRGRALFQFELPIDKKDGGSK